jgi:ATP synthase protein I
MGLMVAACLLVGVLLGRFLDGLLGTSPWLLIIFSLLGAAAAFKSLFDFADRN